MTTLKCKQLNEYYASVFINDNGRLPDFPSRINLALENVLFTPEMVGKSLQKVSKSQYVGPDGIPSIFVYYVKDYIVEPLCKVFTRCFYEGKLPRDWLDANVLPIYKGKNDVTKLDNYRPISLTSMVCKLMER